VALLHVTCDDMPHVPLCCVTGDVQSYYLATNVVLFSGRKSPSTCSVRPPFAVQVLGNPSRTFPSLLTSAFSERANIIYLTKLRATSFTAIRIRNQSPRNTLFDVFEAL